MFNQKVVLVTGASRGLGYYIATKLSEEGAIVVGCSRSPSENAFPFELLQCDVTSEQDVKKVIAFIKQKFGKLDFLINNAGIASMNHSLLTPTSTIEKVLNTNVLGTFIVTRECARLMKNKENTARIVNFSTVAAPLNLEGEAIYSASKTAVESLTKTFAKELAPFGITVNAVGPTPIDTDLIKAVPKDKIAKLIDSQAIKRMGEPRDVYNVIKFYLNPESDFITGQVTYLGGVCR